ncbi:unnamed protein product [Didymodactylos carnosus]|uniref:Innexin n=1 Tax=Didymodactylos carnosus TaxID=1234261 RepID=A0A814JGQ4_9BILA|nr:unnamed protein product [Didymodactylos carnosus]CAF1037437.1 unnamed protein product [Didymodactylos carnosus]CAF3756104.1 unnamed protein product [Didymodactylos carnosus]CAF3807973.1 unnamed protein product [Didymodactylos carnosus]
MEFLKIIDKFSGTLSFANVRSLTDDFLIDRLNYRYTSSLLGVFAFICAVRTSYTVPIICWIPAQIRRYEKAITAYCYANNTYYVPDGQHAPRTANERYQALIFYYQWLPWIFGLQAIFFYLPKLFWQFSLHNSDYNVSGILKAAHKLYLLPDFSKKKSPTKLQEQQLNYLHSHFFSKNFIPVTPTTTTKHRKRLLQRRHYCYFFVLYLVTKFLYLANLCGQILFIHLIIGSKNKAYPNIKSKHFLTEFNQKLQSGISELIDTSSFPKRTLCDFTFRELASNHYYTVECILPLNIIVEKLYVFLYIWFILLAFLILVDIVQWLFRLIRFLSESSRLKYIQHHLIDQHDPNQVQTFVQQHLNWDTYFLFKLLSKNISTYVIVDILEYYFKTQKNKKKDN